MTARDIKGEARPASRIPKFASRQEEREFWDTHDIIDYLDEMTPTTLRYVGKPAEPLTVTLDARAMKRLRAEAKKQGLDPATLLYIWVLEKLPDTDAPTD
jgi:hypothetical protein